MRSCQQCGPRASLVPRARIVPGRKSECPPERDEGTVSIFQRHSRVARKTHRTNSEKCQQPCYQALETDRERASEEFSSRLRRTTFLDRAYLHWQDIHKRIRSGSHARTGQSRTEATVLPSVDLRFSTNGLQRAV